MNDARYFDWPEGLRRYIDDIRKGKGQNPKQYSARYICSLVADFHRSGRFTVLFLVFMQDPCGSDYLIFNRKLRATLWLEDQDQIMQ